MKLLKLIPFSILFLVFYNKSIAEDSLIFKIYIPSNIKIADVKVMLDDGSGHKFISPAILNNSLIIQSLIKDKFNTITIMYPTRESKLAGVRLITTSNTGFIDFKEVEDSVLNKLTKFKFKSAIITNKCKEYVDLKKYSKNENETDVSNAKLYNLEPSEKNLKAYNQSSYVLALKELDYIKSNKGQYFYFWYFRNSIVPSLLRTHQLELYEVFQNSFSGEFKNSYEGKTLNSLLEGNIFVKTGLRAPSFSVIDYLGRPLSSELLSGKHVLICFWATWCVPCVKEIPMIKEISDRYNKNELAIVSISCDDDSLAFISFINKFQMNWFNVYGRNSLRNIYGGKAIPQIYLIDTNGILRFNSWEDDISILKEYLKKEISINIETEN